MENIIWIILGYVLGWIAPDVIGTNTDKSMLLYLILGISGALAGGHLTNTFISNTPSHINLFSITIATLGSIIFMQFGKRLASV